MLIRDLCVQVAKRTQRKIDDSVTFSFWQIKLKHTVFRNEKHQQLEKFQNGCELSSQKSACMHKRIKLYTRTKSTGNIWFCLNFEFWRKGVCLWLFHWNKNSNPRIFEIRYFKMNWRNTKRFPFDKRKQHTIDCALYAETHTRQVLFTSNRHTSDWSEEKIA